MFPFLKRSKYIVKIPEKSIPQRFKAWKLINYNYIYNLRLYSKIDKSKQKLPRILYSDEDFVKKAFK